MWHRAQPESLRLKLQVLDKIYELCFSSSNFYRLSVQLSGKLEHECQALVLEGFVT